VSTDGPYTVSPDYEYAPWNVDATKCSHTTDGPHNCVHDWRVHWGNVEKTGENE
jgi:hypothetical protein